MHESKSQKTLQLSYSSQQLESQQTLQLSQKFESQFSLWFSHISQYKIFKKSREKELQKKAQQKSQKIEIIE